MQQKMDVDEYRLAVANGGVFDNKPRKKSKHEEDDLTIKTANYLDDLKFEGKVIAFTHISNVKCVVLRLIHTSMQLP